MQKKGSFSFCKCAAINNNCTFIIGKTIYTIGKNAIICIRKINIWRQQLTARYLSITGFTVIL
jgi:hypothetical protein